MIVAFWLPCVSIGQSVRRGWRWIVVYDSRLDLIDTRNRFRPIPDVRTRRWCHHWAWLSDNVSRGVGFKRFASIKDYNVVGIRNYDVSRPSRHVVFVLEVIWICWDWESVNTHEPLYIRGYLFTVWLGAPVNQELHSKSFVLVFVDSDASVSGDVLALRRNDECWLWSESAWKLPSAGGEAKITSAYWWRTECIAAKWEYFGSFGSPYSSKATS